jgi:uncharacterized protein
MDECLEFTAPDGTRLFGTLTRPAPSDPAPAALLVNGSGPLDRDSNMPGQTLNVANALASALAAHGVGSLRYDKRGVGRSGGDYLSTGFEQETSDAFTALEALRRSPGIRPDRLTVIGHSVGATIAIRLASGRHELAGVVLLAGSSQPGADVMRRQSERIAESMRGPSRLLARWFLRRQARARRLLLGSTDAVVRIGRSRLSVRWFQEYMAYDPVPELRVIRCPVLAITGRSDIQVEPGDVARIGQVVETPFTGRTPDELTHLLRKHPGRPSLTTYPAQLKKPVDADLLEQIAAWTEAQSFH